MAGAIYGIGGLNPAFVENLQQWDDGDVAVRAYMLHFMGRQAATTQHEAVARAMEPVDAEQAVDTLAD